MAKTCRSPHYLLSTAWAARSITRATTCGCEMYTARLAPGTSVTAAFERAYMARYPGAHAVQATFFSQQRDRRPTEVWGPLTRTVQQAETQGLLARDQVINLESVKVRVLPPPPGMHREKQNVVNSVGLLVQVGRFRLLMTGDSDTPEPQA